MSKKIIAICGSYGKTSLKEILFQILSSKFRVLQSFGNENTPLGISKLVNKLTSEHQILLLEFGEFVVGDIRGLCEFFPPNIGIITGINNQHHERMGGIDKAIQCMFEMAEFCETLVLNIDDQNVRENWQKYAQKNQEIWFYSSENNEKSSLRFQKAEFDKESLNWKVEVAKEDLEQLENLTVFTDNLTNRKITENSVENSKQIEEKNKKNETNSAQILENNLAKKLESYLEDDYILDEFNNSNKQIQKEKQTETFEIKLLGKYAVGNLICGIIISKKLEMTDLEIQLGVANVVPIKHRLEPIWNEKNQVLVVDDSYNGNIDGVLEAIDVLARLK